MSKVVHDDHGLIDAFNPLVESTHQHFKQMMSLHGTRLFKVETDNIYQAYLDNLQPALIAEHTCHTCNRFIEQYGDLAFVTDDGQLVSAIWNPDTAPSPYKSSIAAMAKQVAKGKIVGVFHSKEKVWGQPLTGTWTHFSVIPAQRMIHADRALSPYEAHALSKEHYGTLSRGLADYSREVVSQAMGLIQSEALFRSEKVSGPAQFLLDLHDAIQDVRGPRRNNLIWRAVAMAPVGFCTPRSSMIGTLLDDIAEGLDVDSVRRRFTEKMDPLKYQRPQALPSAGNIAAGEKLVEKLGIAPSLERRYARLDEVQTIWKPMRKKAEASPKGGVFGHLQAKGETSAKTSTLVAPIQNITFEKFRRTVLPNALKIEQKMTESRMNFRGTLTALHADAPPILQWDSEDVRNPFSGYVYSGGSYPSSWGLSSSYFVNVTGIMLNPAKWADESAYPHQANYAVFILDGAQDEQSPSLCLFPEILKSDLHPIRSTIEAYSRNGTVQGKEEASANGYCLSQNGKYSNRFRVTTEHGIAEYCIDRWD